MLMLGGAYLAFEATEKIWEKVSGDHHDEIELLAADTPAELEQRQVAGAIRTDFILSAEIMAIALATLEGNSLAMQGFALAAVGIAITVAVYGVVALIVKLDDIGLHLAERRSSVARAVGKGLVLAVPKMLTSLSAIGTAAMLWVGGGILLHGMEVLGAGTLPHAIHDAAHGLAAAVDIAVPAVEWVANAVAASIAGLVVGALVIVALRLMRRARPAKLATADVPPV